MRPFLLFSVLLVALLQFELSTGQSTDEKQLTQSTMAAEQGGAYTRTSTAAKALDGITVAPDTTSQTYVQCAVTLFVDDPWW